MDKCYSFLTKADILLQRKLTIITKRSILDVAAAIDPRLIEMNRLPLKISDP